MPIHPRPQQSMEGEGPGILPEEEMQSPAVCGRLGLLSCMNWRLRYCDGRGVFGMRGVREHADRVVGSKSLKFLMGNALVRR